jgi:hypothetical protein
MMINIAASCVWRKQLHAAMILHSTVDRLGASVVWLTLPDFTFSENVWCALQKMSEATRRIMRRM